MKDKLILILGFALLLSLVGNAVFSSKFFNESKSGSSSTNIKNMINRYSYLSPRIMIEHQNDILINFLDLREKLRNDTSAYGETFALYFEYLPSGTSIGINSGNEFHAASLFKLPVIMAYYHYRERLNITDDPEITLTKDMLDSQFGTLWQKGAGYKLKASEAVRLALEESDNTAARSLVPFIDEQDFESVYQAIDIALQSDKNGAILTAKNYSSILKALFYSAVLQKSSSQEILNYLSKTKFPDKLEAGVPQSVTVAHKIGDYNDDKGNEAFMDCGIVYVPQRPYILCMLSLTDEQTARARMQEASKTVYDFLSKND